MDQPELVVLLNEAGEPIGAADKASVHTADTPLHLAFSCHISNDAGHVLITRRALTKKTWPGVWTNSACGHPAPEESMEDAIARRARDELGLTLTDIRLALPDFRYRAIDASGVVENEVCPVYTARALGDPQPAESEVCEWRWVSPESLKRAVGETPFVFSPWLVDQMDQWSGDYSFEMSVR